MPPEEALEGGLEEQDLGQLGSHDEVEDLSYATMFANALLLESGKTPELQRKAEQPMRMDDPVVQRPAASQARPHGSMTCALLRALGCSSV